MDTSALATQLRMLPRPPRKVRRRGGVPWRPSLFIFAFLAPGLALTLLAAIRLYVIFAGTHVTVVVDRSEVHGGDYQVRFHYRLDGRRFVGLGYLRASTLPGTILPARASHLGKHSMCVLASYGVFGAFLLLAISLIWDAVLVFLILFIWVPLLMLRWLNRPQLVKGSAAVGVVTEWTVDPGNEKNMWAKYQFTPSGAREPVSGKEFVSGRDLDRVGKLEAVTIFYDLKRPVVSLIYEYSDYQIVGWERK